MQLILGIAAITIISTTLWLTSPVGRYLVFSFHSDLHIQSDQQASEITAYTSRLSSSDEEERYDAVVHLGAIKSQAAINALKLVLNDSSERVRQAALEGMDGVRDLQLIPTFADSLAKDKSIFVRKTAAYALGNMQDPLATQPLVAALKDKDQEVRSAAIVALGQYRDASAIGPLTIALTDKSDFVRARAAFALGLHGRAASNAVPAIVRLFTSDDDVEVRRQAAQALGQIGDRSALPQLERARHSPDPYLRRIVLEAIRLIESSR